jgi:hypothetical protein
MRRVAMRWGRCEASCFASFASPQITQVASHFTTYAANSTRYKATAKQVASHHGEDAKQQVVAAQQHRRNPTATSSPHPHATTRLDARNVTTSTEVTKYLRSIANSAAK